MATTPLSERKRSVDLNNFSDTEIEELSKKIGDLMSEKVRNCVIDCQKVLQIYGMDIFLQYSLFPIGFPPPMAKSRDIEEEEVDDRVEAMKAEKAKLDAEAEAMSLKDGQVAVNGKKKRGRPKKVIS